MYSILIVEDDKALSNGIVLALKKDNCFFIQTYDIAAAKNTIAEKIPDLIILDVNLPDGNGLELLTEIRKNSTIPIILLTANDMETDIVTGLEMGADDYITKPFSLMILRARVNAQLRKSQVITASEIQIDNFSFSFEKMEFLRDKKPLELSKTEQKLLKILIDNKGSIVARTDLVDRIWTDGAEYVDENALSVTIKRLRNKLEDMPSSPKYIKTVYGIGYTWAVK